MYLIGNKGVMAAINREISMDTILHQLSHLDDKDLEMADGFIKGLKLARTLRKK